MRYRSLALLSCVCAVVACTERETPPVTADAKKPSPATAASPVPIDACSLLTSDEIQAVQGEPTQEAKSSQRSDRGLAIADCYFALPAFSNAVSLSIGHTNGGPKGQNAAEFWKQMFDETTLRGSEKSPPPKKLEGLGDDAYWTGDGRMGAVHVLKGPHYLRISVGGPGDQEEKIRRCRALIEAALKRL